MPLQEREIGHGAIYRVKTDGAISEVAKIEYPNGLAFPKDERTLYAANTRWNKYIHAMELDFDGNIIRRRLFADMSSDGDGRTAYRTG